MEMTNNKTVCTRCTLDTTIPGIRFDHKGECNYCKVHDELEKQFPLGELGKKKFEKLLNDIKTKGKNKKYDCIVGISGGTDSTYCLYLAKKFGLRPLAVHLDNGWDGDIAIENMKKATSKLGIDFKLISVDWEEFRKLQVAFLKASIPDPDSPADIAIHSILYKVAAEEGVNYAINGHSFRVEGVSPMRWCYMDARYVKAINRQFGKAKLESFPNLTISDLLYYVFKKKIKFVPLLAYVDYRKEDTMKLLKKELDWTYYGGHHHENIYTRWIGVHLRPKKFNIDSRMTEYAALVRSGQITRDVALEEINKPIPEDNETTKLIIEKLGLTEQEMDAILAAPPKTFLDYPTYYSLIKTLRIPIKVACNMNLLPHIFYQKYFECI